MCVLAESVYVYAILHDSQGIVGFLSVHELLVCLVCFLFAFTVRSAWVCPGYFFVFLECIVHVSFLLKVSLECIQLHKLDYSLAGSFFRLSVFCTKYPHWLVLSFARPPKGGRGISDVSHLSGSQGCQFDPTFLYLLSYSSA